MEPLDAGFNGSARSGIRRPLQRGRWLLGLLAGGFVVVVVVPFVYFHLVEGSAPPPLALPVGPGGAAGPLNGTWKVTAPSQVEYRVKELLFGQHDTAVGRTTEVTGAIVITGATVTSGRFRVDMASVSSGQAGRDAQFRGYIMDTGSYPYAQLTLAKPIDLRSLPRPGQLVSEQVTASLTLRGVTRPVTFTIGAERAGPGIDVSGSIPVRFSRWHIPNPSFAVAQVGDTGTIDVLLHLVRGA